MRRGRPSIQVKLTITSNDDDRFSNPRTFNSIPDASLANGLTDREIRAAYYLKQDSMQKRSGKVYHLRWEELDPIRDKPPRTVTKECVKCSKTLTSEDRSMFFLMDRGFNKESLQFGSIYQASKKTGISICALRNACKKVNLTFTKQKGGRPQKFEVY